MFGPIEIAVIAALVVLFFGASRIPRVANELGRVPAMFRRGAVEATDDPEEVPHES